MREHHTFGVPVLISNSSNNYGPHQFPEKFIPLMSLSALDGKALLFTARALMCAIGYTSTIMRARCGRFSHVAGLARPTISAVTTSVPTWT